MEEISNLFHLLRKDSSFNVVSYDFKGKQILNSQQFHFQVDCVFQVLECISANQSLIGCILKPSISLPAVILGILKVSSSFAFLDVHKPLVQLRNLQKYAPLRTLLVEEAAIKSYQDELCKCWVARKELYLEGSVSLVFLQSAECTNEECPNSCNSKGFSPNPGLAYVVQTSGTTGDPKVVQVPHQCILPNITDLRSRFDVTCRDVVFLCSPLTFDPSVVDIFLAVSAGSTLVIVPDQIKSIPNKLMDVIVDSKVTILQCTPSLFRSLGEPFIRDHLLSRDSCLRALAFGGEQCPSLTKLQQWKSEGNKTQIFNLYGLTELSCWASCYQIDIKKRTSSSNVPLGEPLLDTIIEVRNGEVYIGGNQRWCVVNDEAWPNCDSFIMRSTGDLVLETTDCNLLFMGRKDDIVKYKGQKLSLHKIRDVLEGVSEISDHCAYFDAESSNLLLFVVQNTPSNIDLRERVMRELRGLISNLPVTQVILVPEIPLTAHGKSNYRKLLKVAKEQLQLQGMDNSLCNKSCDELLRNLWMNYTNQPNVHEDANFVLQGGDSVSALLLTSDVERKLRVQIPELVDRLLHNSFKEVEELITFHMNDSTKNKNEKHLHEFREENVSSKKPRLSGFDCHEVSSQRGHELCCRHSAEDACVPRRNPCGGGRPILTMVTKFDLKKCIDASPTVSYYFRSEELLVFIGSHSGLFGCISIASRDFLWITRLPDRIESSSCLSSCGNFIVVAMTTMCMACVPETERFYGNLKLEAK